MSDMQKQAAKQAARTVQNLAGLSYQQAGEVAINRRADLIPDGDIPMDDTSVLGEHTWADAVLFIADDEQNLDTPAQAYSVKTILRVAGYETHTSTNELTITTATGPVRVKTSDWQLVRVIGSAVRTNVPSDCPSPSRVVDDIMRAIAAATEVTVEDLAAALADAPFAAYRQMGELHLSYEAGGEQYESRVDLAASTVTVYREGDEDKLYTVSLHPDAPTVAGLTNAIIDFVEGERSSLQLASGPWSSPSSNSWMGEQGATQPAAPSPQAVWTLETWHRHGSDLGVYATEEASLAGLHAYVAQCWEEAAERSKNQRKDFPTAAEVSVENPDWLDERPMTIDEAEAAGYDVINVYYKVMDDEGYELLQTTIQN